MAKRTKKSPVSGKLLEEISFLVTPMGLSYARGLGLGPRKGRHERITVLCPRGSTRLAIKTAVGEAETIDSTQVLWLPPISHSFQPKSSMSDVMILHVSPEYFDAMIADNGLDSADKKFLELKPLVLKRTKWLDDILERYFFERVLNRHSPPGCTFFLEKQIINELARIVFREKLKTWETKNDQLKEGFDAAIRFIEANLFEKLDLEKLAETSGLSESSLLRYFKRELATTPYAYIRERRLDEAKILLKKREHPVSDIALLVGYEDFSAFSRAFRERFGHSPRERT